MIISRQRQDKPAPTELVRTEIFGGGSNNEIVPSGSFPVKLLSVDIEIANVFELVAGEDLDRYAPFDISVAATVVDGGEERLWYSTDANGRPLVAVTRDKAHELLRYLQHMQSRGYQVCAWNGLSFDLRWIGHVAQNHALAAEIALRCFDPMLQFFNQRGFPVSLASVARAMGIKQGKLMNGADAPVQWRAGNHRAVMDYVVQDCKITNEVVRLITARKEIRWVTKTGALRQEPIRILKPVAAVLDDPEPDQSWMTSPLPRSKFCRWLKP